MNSEKRSTVLMRWLSSAATSLGVAEHLYVVGGAVRDFLLGRPIKDLDLVLDSVRAGRDSNWLAGSLQTLIPAETSLVTNQYGVAILTVRTSWTLEGVEVRGEVLEIANARTESYGGRAGKGYKPHMVVPSRIEDDLIRREFTFNCLLWRLSEVPGGPAADKVLDLLGTGIQDLHRQTMRCPGGDPVKTFADDPTRLVRMGKFAMRYGFMPDRETRQAVEQTGHLLHAVPHNAVSTIFLGVLDLGVRKALETFEALGVLGFLQEVMVRNAAAKAAMEHWASELSVEDNLSLRGRQFPVARWASRVLHLISEAELGQVVGRLGSQSARTWCQAVLQPGTLLDMESLIADHGLQGREIRRVDQAVLAALREAPALIAEPAILDREVRKILVRIP